MSVQLSLAALLNLQTEAQIYDAALSTAATIGLPVTSWSPGDPTRSLFYLESAVLAALETIVVGYVQSGFLDYAAIPNPDGSVNPWLAILAQQVFGVTVPGATFASATGTLTNASGGIYVIEPGDLSVKDSSTSATYTNTTAITLTGVGSPGATGTVTVVADLAGAASSAGIGEIDTVVSGFNGVTFANTTAAVGLDAQPAQTTVSQCRDKLAALSPNGPAAAYTYVALNSALTGVQTVTRARTYPTSETGDVLVVVASSSGTVSGGDVTNVQNAINQWATPLCITPTVQSATAESIAVSYQVWIYQSANASQADIEAQILTVLENFFANRPIGGDVIPPATTGNLYASMVAAEIATAYPNDTFRVVLSLPGSDISLTTTQVPILGSVTPVVNIIPVPL